MKSRTITHTLAAATVLALTSLTACSGSSDNADARRADSLEAVVADLQAQQSAGAGAEESQATAETFTTPDLQLFDIHGHVKSIHANFDYLFVKPEKTATFDEEGNWTNPERTMNGIKISYTRDSDGRLVKVNSPKADQMGQYYWMAFSDTFVWGDNRVEKILYDGSIMCTAYTYNDDGELIKEVSDTAAEGTNYVDVTTYSNYKYDEQGNWTSRHFKTVSKEYDDTCEEAGGTHELLNSSTTSGTQTRRITYY